MLGRSKNNTGFISFTVVMMLHLKNAWLPERWDKPTNVGFPQSLDRIRSEDQVFIISHAPDGENEQRTLPKHLTWKRHVVNLLRCAKELPVHTPETTQRYYYSVGRWCTVSFCARNSFLLLLGMKPMRTSGEKIKQWAKTDKNSLQSWGWWATILCGALTTSSSRSHWQDPNID